eukprot:scaffold728_cov259-Skeletonema_marinoi.AAC.1
MATLHERGCVRPRYGLDCKEVGRLAFHVKEGVCTRVLPQSILLWSRWRWFAVQISAVGGFAD